MTPGGSQIRIIEQTPSQFTALDPPYTAFGFTFAAFGLALALLMVFVAWKTHGFRPVYIVGYVAALAFLLIGAVSATTTSYIMASRQTGVLEVRTMLAGNIFNDNRVPLDQILVARVETVKNTTRVVVVLRSGQVVRLTSATDRDGYDLVAQAINSLLVH